MTVSASRPMIRCGLVRFTQFRDSYGATVRVQSSSAAEKPHVWVYIGVGMANSGDVAAHLTRGQAKRLRDALDRWLRGAR